MDIDTPSTMEVESKSAPINTTPSASSESASKYPNMELAQSIHQLVVTVGPNPRLDADEAKGVGISSDLNAKVMKQVGGSDVENPSLYRELKGTLGWESMPGCLSEEELKAMEEKNTATLVELEKKVEEAKEQSGDMEVLDARFAIARFAAKSLSKDEALDAYDKVLALPKLSSGKTIDALMESARVASFYGDTTKNASIIDRVSLHIFLPGHLHIPKM
jgi:26S proteasome regulatory subunit N7